MTDNVWFLYSDLCGPLKLLHQDYDATWTVHCCQIGRGALLFRRVLDLDVDFDVALDGL